MESTSRWALYILLLLMAAVVYKFFRMFWEVFGDDDGSKKVRQPYVNVVAGEGPCDSAVRWLNYHKKVIISNRIINDVKIPEEEKTDIDRGVDHAQSVLNEGGPCEITISTKTSFYVHVINEILLILTKKVNREVDGTTSKFFFEKDGVYMSKLSVK